MHINRYACMNAKTIAELVEQFNLPIENVCWGR